MIDQKMPLSRSILWILVSTLFISGSAFMGWLYSLHVRERRIHDDQYNIVAVVQSSSESDHLKTVYLTELLDLALDRPINLYQFNVQEAIKRLSNHPLLKEAAIKKILPGTLYVHYRMRTPVAYVGDFTNTAIDEEGYLFPFRPFFTPKCLPTVYLGLNQGKCQWGSCVKELSSVQLAFDLLCQFDHLLQKKFHLKQLDVTHALADSYGQRQIVMVLEEAQPNPNVDVSKMEIFLRLSSDNPQQDLINFNTLQNDLFKKEKQVGKIQSMIFDFRISHLAFIKKQLGD